LALAGPLYYLYNKKPCSRSKTGARQEQGRSKAGARQEQGRGKAGARQPPNLLALRPE
jgi:hypothetical protein